jgi:DivIVA domain-containing protein
VMVLALMLAVVLVAITVAAVLGRVDGSLPEPMSALSYVPLPSDRITPEDIVALRIDTGLRGYRMEQVDEVIDRLADEIAFLRRQLPTESAQLPTESAQHPESAGQTGAVDPVAALDVAARDLYTRPAAPATDVQEP